MLVIEEYDKLDCEMRGFFRQLLENGAVANVTMNKCAGGWYGDGGGTVRRAQCLLVEWLRLHCSVRWPTSFPATQYCGGYCSFSACLAKEQLCPPATHPRCRAIIVLESNLGYTELHDLLVKAGDRRWVQHQAAPPACSAHAFAAHVWQLASVHYAMLI